MGFISDYGGWDVSLLWQMLALSALRPFSDAINAIRPARSMVIGIRKKDGPAPFDPLDDFERTERQNFDEFKDLQNRLIVFATRHRANTNSAHWELRAAAAAILTHPDFGLTRKRSRGRPSKKDTPEGEANLHAYIVVADRLRAYLEWKLGHKVRDSELALHMAARKRGVGIGDEDLDSQEFEAQRHALANELSKNQKDYEKLLRKWGPDGPPRGIKEIAQFNYERLPEKRNYAWTPTETEMESWSEWQPLFLRNRTERKTRALARQSLP